MAEFEITTRYLAQKRLGSGSFGDVYLCQDRKLGRQVAVKLMKGSGNAAAAIKDAELFRREAKLLALLDHVNVVRIFDYDVADDGALFLVMEYLDGRVLTELKLPLDMDVISQFVAQIAAALHSAHERGLIHRDLKPANVMYIDRGGLDSRFVLLDLGIAKLVNATQGAGHTIRNATFGGPVGSLPYMAPEQVVEGEVDGRTDVYAFGSTLFELLTGSTPLGHISGTQFTIFNAITSAAPRRLSEVAPDTEFPSGLEELIDDCLRKNPDERPASMRQVVERFQAVLTRHKEVLVEAERQRIRDLELPRHTLRAEPEGLREASSPFAATIDTRGGSTAETLPDPVRPPTESKKSAWLEQAEHRWTPGVAGLLLVLILPVLAAVWWNWPRPPTPVVPLSFAKIDDQMVGEEDNWSFLAVAKLPDGRKPRLHYALGANAPAGLTIEPENGLMKWKPTESDGGGDAGREFPVRVEVEGLEPGIQGTSVTFTIRVLEVNRPPTLNPIVDQLVEPGKGLDLQITASDLDLPPQELRYQLRTDVPGARIENGRLIWTPLENQVGRDHAVEISVSDSPAGHSEQTPPVSTRFNVSCLKQEQVAIPEKMGRTTAAIWMVRNSTDMEFVLLEPATFQMGSPLPEKDRQNDELAHQVKLSKRLLFGRHEVTNDQFSRFIKARMYVTEAERAKPPGKSWQDAFSKPGLENHPVVNVSWNDAREFCKWLSEVERLTYRLPNEAEWEHACRAGSNSRFFGGDDDKSLQAFANILDQSALNLLENQTLAASWNDQFPNTSPVGAFQANGFGIFNMAGNVWEWCADRYATNNHATDNTGKGNPLTIDPTGAEFGDQRVLRGGSWLSLPRDARSATRDAGVPTTIQNNIGFRVVREVRFPE